MYGLPPTYQQVEAAGETIVQLTITIEAGGDGFLLKEPDKWALQTNPAGTPATHVIIPPDITGKLFSKSLRPEQIMDHVTIIGNNALAQIALGTVSVMA